MLELFYKYPRVLNRLRSGPLGVEMDGIAAHLSRVGYTRGSSRSYLAQIARFSQFAATVGHEVSGSIDRDVAERFLLEIESPAAQAIARTAIGHALRHIQGRFSWTRGPESSQDQASPLLVAFDEYLRDVCGLQPKTREGMRLVGRRALVWLRDHLPGQPLSDLTGAHVLRLATEWPDRCATDRTRSVGSSYLRSFLRYLRWAGLVDEDLARLVPRTPSWRMAHLPVHLEWEDVRRVIDAVNTTSALGKRDRALLLLFATTGARSQELRLLELRDVRWRTSEILVRRTKTRRERVLPLLEEAGSALAEYILHGRPQVATPHVFLCHRPPVRPLGSSGTVSSIVRRRLAQCDLRPRWAGAHLLRHTLATRMVGQGRSIKEVADLLGHRSIDTTAIYVKVALPQLAGVGLPFPGGRS